MDIELHADPHSESASQGCTVGFPTAPEAMSRMYFLLMQEWLDDCNKNHKDHAKIFLEASGLPTNRPQGPSQVAPVLPGRGRKREIGGLITSIGRR